jgi:nucleoside 2-deoxyribosyltransferase
MSTNHAIIERDRWMVRQCDILYINLKGATEKSIGSIMELAWACMLDKYVVLVMDDGNVHEHAFVVEAADIRFKDEESALDYLEKFARQEI